MMSTPLLPIVATGLLFTRIDLGIPSQPTLVGVTLFHQAFVFDRRANALGITASNGVATTIGAR